MRRSVDSLLDNFYKVKWCLLTSFSTFLHLSNVFLISEFLALSKSQLSKELNFYVVLIVVQTLGTFSVCGNIDGYLQCHSCILVYLMFLCSGTKTQLKFYHLKSCSLDNRNNVMLKFMLLFPMYLGFRADFHLFIFF